MTKHDDGGGLFKKGKLLEFQDSRYLEVSLIPSMDNCIAELIYDIPYLVVLFF